MPKTVQSESTARNQGGRKPGTGGRNNPETDPTPRQRELQERAFMLSVQGRSTRWIANELGMQQALVCRYIRIEERRHAGELKERRDTEKGRAIAFYSDVARRAVDKADAGMMPGDTARYGDAIKARERIDKLLGLEAAVQVEVTERRVKFDVVDEGSAKQS